MYGASTGIVVKDSAASAIAVAGPDKGPDCCKVGPSSIISVIHANIVIFIGCVAAVVDVRNGKNESIDNLPKVEKASNKVSEPSGFFTDKSSQLYGQIKGKTISPP